jgi:hypothetical protein
MLFPLQHQSPEHGIGAWRRFSQPCHSNHGMALVVVLSMLVLVTGLMVASIQAVSFGYKAAHSYQQGINTRILLHGGKPDLMPVLPS